MEKKPLATFVLGIAITVVLFSSLFLFQIVLPNQNIAPVTKTAQAPQELQKFKAVSESATNDGSYLKVDAGKDLGIFASNGLDPEWVTPSTHRPRSGSVLGAADIKDPVESGVKIGYSSGIESVKAMFQGVPIKVVAVTTGETTFKVFVQPDGPIRSMNDLNGRKIGVDAIPGPQYVQFLALTRTYTIKAEAIATGNATQNLVALKVGRVDAFFSPSVSILQLVDTGELRVLLRMADILPKPFVSADLWATDDLIAQNPDLVKRFVKATLETIKYLKENPSYAADLVVKKSGASKELAMKTVGQLDWTPSISRVDLMKGITNMSEFAKEIGEVGIDANLKIEDAVNVSFLP